MNNKVTWLVLALAAGLVMVSVRFAWVSNQSAAPSPEAVSGAEVIDNIMSRASVRKYTDEAPTDSMVQVLLRAGMAAHSSGNKQPWRMIVIVDDEVRDSIGSVFHNMKAVASAPVAIAVCGVPGETFQGEGDGYWVADCAAMSQNITLAAHAMGLGSVTCAVYPRKDRVTKIRELLQLCDTLVPFAIIPVGYSKTATLPKQKWNESKISYL